jgi:hypothetical protein
LKINSIGIGAGQTSRSFTDIFTATDGNNNIKTLKTIERGFDWTNSNLLWDHQVGPYVPLVIQGKQVIFSISAIAPGKGIFSNLRGELKDTPCGNTFNVNSCFNMLVLQSELLLLLFASSNRKILFYAKNN